MSRPEFVLLAAEAPVMLHLPASVVVTPGLGGERAAQQGGSHRAAVVALGPSAPREPCRACLLPLLLIWSEYQSEASRRCQVLPMISALESIAQGTHTIAERGKDRHMCVHKKRPGVDLCGENNRRTEQPFGVVVKMLIGVTHPILRESR